MNDEQQVQIKSGGHRTPVWRRRLLRLALIWGVWTFIGIVFTLQSYFTALRSQQPMTMLDSAYLQFTWSYLWALFTPLVLLAAAKIPFERNNWIQASALHVPISLGLSIIVTAIGHVFVWYHFGREMGRSFSFSRMTSFVVSNFSEGVGIYMLIALFSYVLSYYRRFRESQLKTFQLEAQLSNAQLQALKMQLQPHFLFNTLHSISALMSKDSEAARKMITRLGDFLRLTLENSGTQEVTLEQELAFLQCYLEIQRIRFQDRLTTEVNVSEETLDAKVPNLILQPIVENAIRHGIAPRSSPGLIEIHTERHNSTLRIQVRDNGPGLSDHRKSERVFKKGLGLANTEKRLEQLYGAEHLFDIGDDPRGGLLVTLEIPFHQDGSAGTEVV
ncbi:MAG TPA: histidine kinase [Pyrinomonadaceae bacterium]|nr:histidine kinase [Pyrinomonadaceae bacterium]